MLICHSQSSWGLGVEVGLVIFAESQAGAALPNLVPGLRLGLLAGLAQKRLACRANFCGVLKAPVGDVELPGLGIRERNPFPDRFTGRKRGAGNASLPASWDKPLAIAGSQEYRRR